MARSFLIGVCVKNIIFILIIIILTGCCSTREIRIEDKPQVAVSPTIEDSLDWYWADSLGGEYFFPCDSTGFLQEMEAIRKKGKDTTIIIKVVPHSKKVYITVKPDTVHFTYRDTTATVIEKIIQTPFLSKLGLVVIGALIGAVLLVVGYFALKR